MLVKNLDKRKLVKGIMLLKKGDKFFEVGSYVKKLKVVIKIVVIWKFCILVDGFSVGIDFL